MQALKVTLAGREYQVEPLRIKDSKKWRGQVEGLLGELTAVLGSDLAQLDAVGIGGLIELARRLLINSPDLILDWVCGYAPAVARDRERIEAEGFDEEVFAVFVAVLKVAYPFGVLLREFKPRG